jgi:hypothetical protein
VTISDIREFTEVRAGLLDDEYPPMQVSINTVGASVWSNGRNRPIVLTNEGRIVAKNAGLTAPVGAAFISAVTSVESDEITDKISVGVARYDTRRQLYSNIVVLGIDQDIADPGSGNYVSWVYDPEYNEDVPEGVFPHISFLESPENKGGFTVSGLETLLGDHETDEYDQIAVLIYSWTSGEWFVVRFIDVADIDSYGYVDESVTITVFQAGGGDDEQGLSFFPLYTPNQSYVFPAVRSLRTMTVGGQQRLVGAHMAGFDCFKDMPPLYKGRALDRIDGNGILTLNVPESGTDIFDGFRDGTHIIIGYDSHGDEILRGFIGPATEEGGDYYYGSETVSDVDGSVLAFNQVQVCRTFERNSVYEQDGDINEGQQTWVIRRQLVASATEGSKEIKLYHDADLSIPAQNARQYWVHALATIQGLGTGFIDKVHTVDGTWHGSLDNGTEIGNGLMLREEWDWPTGSGFFSVEGRSRVVFIGRSGRSTFDTTGLGFEIPTLSRTSIMAIEYLRGDLLVLTQIGQAYTLNPNPFADPATFELAVTFDVREAVPDRSLHYNGTCVSNQTWVYQDGSVGWIGADGPWVLDGVTFVPIADQEVQKLWSSVPKQALFSACCAVDQAHKSGPVVRFGGMRQTLTGKNRFQVGLHITRGHWLDYTDSATMDCCTVALMDNGTQRVLFGGEGRLWLWGNQDAPRHGFPVVPKARYGTASALRDINGQTVLVPADGEFTTWGGRRFWNRAGIRVAVIDDTGDIQTGIVDTIQPTGELLVTPLVGQWLMQAGRTYRFIIGPRMWSIELPWRTATGGYTGVEAQMFQFDATDESSFDWPLEFSLEGSRTTPNLDTSSGVAANKKIDRKRFTRQRFLAQNNAVRMGVGPDHRIRLTFEGIHPPDTHLTIRRILLGLRYHGRL